VGRNEGCSSIAFTCSEGMSNGAVHIAVSFQDPAGTAFESLGLPAIEKLEAPSECLAEQLVEPKPASLVVEWDEEEVARLLDLQQPLPR